MFGVRDNSALDIVRTVIQSTLPTCKGQLPPCPQKRGDEMPAWYQVQWTTTRLSLRKRRRQVKQHLSPPTTSNTNPAHKVTSNGNLEDIHSTPLVKLPPELFDEIISYFPTIPSNFYAAAAPEPVPSDEYCERTIVLRALSQSCKALRHVAFTRQWDRLDLCFVPDRVRSVWYKYVNDNIRKKAVGVVSSGSQVQDSIRYERFIPRSS